MGNLRRDRHWISLVLGAAIALSGCEEPSTRHADSQLSDASSSIGPVLEHAFRQSSRFDRIERLASALVRLDASQIDEAVAVYEVEHWWLGTTEIELLMETWTRFDPAAALEYAGKWPDPMRRPAALSAVIRGWALRDPQAANQAVETIGAAYPMQRQLFVENLLTGWVQSGQPGLIEYIADRREVTFPTNAMWIAGGQTRRLGVPGVLDWLDGHLTSDLPAKLKLNLFRRVTGMASRLDPAGVAVWLKTHEGQEYTNRAPTLLVERWVSLDPDAAMNWVAASIPEEERIPMLRMAFTKWVTTDIAGSGAWIEMAPTAKAYDPAFRAYAIVMARRDPVSAMSWAARITNEESRRTALTRVASSWYRRDAEAAENWLLLSELDEQSRDQVRSAPGRKRIRPLEQPQSGN